MKRHSPDPSHFALLKSLDDVARASGKSILDVATQEELLERLRESLREHVNHEARLHGIRVESIFAHLAAAMGSCRLISEEDSGIFFDTDGDLKRPDFRIVTLDSAKMLVEVKNFHQKQDPRKPFRRIKGEYLRSLKKYAALNSLPLRLAIYWSRWNLWTLLDAERLDESQDIVEINMNYAVLHNEMHLLGDCMLGTVPPLSLRFYADKNEPRAVNSGGESAFRIAKACLCSAGVDIEDPAESKVGWFFILFGQWRESEEHAHVVDGLIEYVETRFTPPDPPDGDENSAPFRMIGFMSQMITSQYLWSTSEDSKIKNLVPVSEPGDLGVLIPLNYKGEALKLWRFTLLPTHHDEDA